MCLFLSFSEIVVKPDAKSISKHYQIYPPSSETTQASFLPQVSKLTFRTLTNHTATNLLIINSVRKYMFFGLKYLMILPYLLLGNTLD